MTTNLNRIGCWVVVVTAILCTRTFNDRTAAQSTSAEPVAKPLRRGPVTTTQAATSRQLGRAAKLMPTKPRLKKPDAVEMALNADAKFDFVDTPLAEVAKFLRENYKIVVSIDKIAIEDGGYDVKVPMTGQGNGRSLRSALRTLFEERDFIALARDEELLITTQESIFNQPEKYVVCRMYDVSDLAKPKADKLLNVIERSIAPQSWLDSNGGPGTLDTLDVNGKTILVVNHHSEVHFRIAEFLKDLRAIASSN